MGYTTRMRPAVLVFILTLLFASTVQARGPDRETRDSIQYALWIFYDAPRHQNLACHRSRCVSRYAIDPVLPNIRCRQNVRITRSYFYIDDPVCGAGSTSLREIR